MNSQNKSTLRARRELIQDLRKIQSTFREISGTSSQVNQFRADCERWIVRREETLSLFSELQDELNSIHTKTSAARTVGAGVSVLGGLAAAIGFGLRLTNNPVLKAVGEKMTEAGGAAGVVGGVAAGAACVAEGYLSKTTLNKIETALKEDQRQTGQLCPWFQRSQELQNHLNKVFGFSILSDSMSEFSYAVEELQVICEQGGKTLHEVMVLLSESGDQISARGLNRKHIEGILMHAGFVTKHLLREFCVDERVQQAVLSICNSIRRSPISFEIAKACFGASVLQVKFLMKFPSLRNLSMPSVEPYSSTFLMTQGLFCAINLAFSVLAFLSAAKDVQEGKSKYNEMLDDVKLCLNNELKSFANQYKKKLNTLKKRETDDQIWITRASIPKQSPLNYVLNVLL